MTGPDVPDFNDLDPNSLPEDGLPEGSLPGHSSPEEAWDWVDLDRQDETGPIESTEPESDPAVAGGLRSVGFIDGPAARNGKNGHGGPASATRAPARRGSRGKAASHSSRPGNPPANKSLIAALVRAAMRAEDGEEASLMAAAAVPLIFEQTVPAGQQDKLHPALPALMKGTAVLAALLVDEEARSLLRLLPGILEQTFRILDRAAGEGRPITRKLAGDVLAEKTAAMIARDPGRHDDNAKRARTERRPDASTRYSNEPDGDNGDDTF